MPLRFLPILALLLLAGCRSSGERIDGQAHAAGLSRSVVAGQTYRHVIYANHVAVRPAGPWAERLMVFLDGDGRPWSDDGQRPSSDPTTRNPIALKLLAQTPVSGIYVSRPCYQQQRDASCSSDIWTSGRYSSAVVDSIATAVRDASRSSGLRKVVVVGYSGGGALAVLVAERLENIAAIVTLSANLDTDAWTAHHGYLPLTGSLNPATSGHEHAWPEIHLQGELDTVVPPATTLDYFKRHPAARPWLFDGYDHVCCWVDAWPGVFAKIQAALDNPDASVTSTHP